MSTFRDLTQAIDNYQSTGNASNSAVSPEDVVMPELETVDDGGLQNLHPVTKFDHPSAISLIKKADKVHGLAGSESYFNSAVDAGWGGSRYDERTGYTPGMDVEEARANAQPGVWKIGNGIIKGGITAAVTAANTVAGTVAGAGAAMFNYQRQMLNDIFKNTGHDLGEVVDAGVNNFLSEKLMDIQNWSEKAFPNYRTAEERSEQYQREWYKHMGTANFIGDSLIKNFGFTVGAIGGGSIWSSLISKALSAKLVGDVMRGATVAAEGDAAAIQELVQAAQAIPTGAQVTVDASRFAGNLKRAAQQINKAGSKLQFYGAALGAMGEGSMEGLMAKKEFLDEHLPQIKQEYISLIDEAEQDILNSGNPDYYDVVRTLDYDGTVREDKVLTKRGQAELLRRKQLLQEMYENKVSNAEQLGERLASIVYGLNFPLLTFSNTVEFAKIFSGGWKTARTLRNISGTMGNYRGLLGNMSEKAAVRTMTAINSLKNGGTEAFEEMAQGFISSGIQGAATNFLTQYNDDGYDDRATASLFEWVANMWPEGKNYLLDPKNWQEGFIGALTGLFGIPGRGYLSGNRGGIPGAIAEARQQVTESRDAADKLNTIVNTPEFQDRWRAYVRHLKYDNEMEDALAADDKKAWTDASEKQIISDIMAFAKAGRLDDVRRMANEFMRKFEADADDIRDAMEGNDPSKQVVTKNKSDKDIIDNVVEKATELNDRVKEYSDVYDALLTLAPANYSDKLMEELVFTAMNIKSVERRYLSMLNKDLADAEASITAVAGKGLETDEEKQAAVTKMKSDLERAFSSLLPGGSNAEIRKQSKQVITALRKKIGDSDKNLSKVLDDMEKISNDRYELYNKYQRLLSGEAAKEYEQQAETQEKKQEKNAKKQVKTEAQGYKTIDDVKVSYRDLVQQKGLATEFFQQLEELAPTSKPVQDFLELHDVNSDFLSFYQDNGLGVSEDMTVAKSAERIILERMFDEAQNKGQYLDFDFNFDSFEDDGTVIPGGRVKTQLNAITGPTIAGMGGVDIIGRAYDQAVAAIKKGLDEYKKISNYVSGRKKPTSSKKKSNTGDSPTLRGMTGDKPTIAGMAGRPSQVEEGQEEEPERTGETHKDSLGREWQVGQKAYMYKLDNEGEITPFLTGEYTIKNFYDSNGKHMMTLVDANNKRILVDLDRSDIARLSPVKQEGYEPVDDDTTVVVRNQSGTEGTLETIKTTDVNDLSEEEQEEIGGEDDVTSNEEKHYYRTGMPEIDSFDARDVRRILKNRNLTLREKLSAIFKINLKDFYLKNEAYRPTWQMLSNFLRSDAADGEEAQNAFENTAFVANVGDQVEFRIDPKFDILDQDGKPQILVYTVKEGKSYLLNTLGHNTTKTTYENIDELRDTILAQYEKSDKSKVFVFTNEATGEPYRSTIWSKRNGIVVYDESKAPTYAKEKAIKDIPGYDPNAPIVFINKTGDQIQLSGSAYNRTYLSNLSDDEECHGNLYYLARGKNGYCIPIRLNVEHFRQESLKEDSVGYNAQTFKNIRGAIKDIAKVGSEILGSPIDDLNAANSRLSNAVKTLGRYLDIHDYIFRIMQKKDGEYVLRVWVNNNKGTGGWFNSDTLTEERLLKYIANQKLPVNIGETSNITSLVSGGIITSNAQALWAKGTDIYYYRWTGNGFEPYNKQEKISKDLPGSVEEESENSDKVDKEVVKKNMKSKKKGTGAVPTEASPAQATESALETSIREQLTGKVGSNDMGSVVRGILLTVQGKNVRRLLDGLRTFGATTDGEEAEKAFIKILGAATTRAERDEMRAEISNKTGIPVKDITTYEMYEYYMTRTEDSPLTSRISNLVIYSNFVKDVLSALSGSAPRTSEQPAPVDDIKTELASVDYNTVKFENLSGPVKKVLLDSGCDEETFNMLSPEGKKSALSCLGI